MELFAALWDLFDHELISQKIEDRVQQSPGVQGKRHPLGWSFLGSDS